MDDKANELALKAMQKINMGVFKVWTTLDIKRPETIHSFSKFAELLHDAYKEGQADAAVTAVELPKWIDDQKGKDPFMDDIIKWIEANITKPLVEPIATVIKKGADRQWMSENLGSMPDGVYPLYLRGLPVSGNTPPMPSVKAPASDTN